MVTFQSGCQQFVNNIDAEKPQSINRTKCMRVHIEATQYCTDFKLEPPLYKVM